MTSEHPCHLFLKRAMLNEHLGGCSASCDLAVAEDFMVQGAQGSCLKSSVAKDQWNVVDLSL